MGLKYLTLIFSVIGFVSAQNYKVCILSTASSICQSLERDGSLATCQPVDTRVDCALKLSRGEADIGYFSEEEALLLSQQQPNDNRVIATIRDVNRMDPFGFEAVAVVPANHTGGLAGLRGGRYCHPGLEQDLRWSPRVLKTLEELSARTDRCSGVPTDGKTAEELEVENLNGFFSAACRPGSWSANASVDANLKSRFPSLCSLCAPTSNCSGYNIDMGPSISGVRNDNRHIQALECLRTNSNGSTPAVAYVAWTHVREFFTMRNPQDAQAFALLCSDGTLQALTAQVLNNSTSPCALVRQPWGVIVTSTASSTALLTNLRLWWPNGADPGMNTWQSTLYSALVGGANARVVFQDAPVSPLNYTLPIRSIPAIDSTETCIPARRWCTISLAEQTKCTWIRSSAYTLGLQPSLSCQQRASIFECLTDIRDGRADFISAPSNYGYIARQHYRLTPVKMVQNVRAEASRVAAFVKESATLQNITRFENLRDKKACFPEYGGLAYVAFVRAAQERSVISASECDYAKAVGEFFEGACAPGAIDASHALSDSTFNVTSLCTVCKPTIATVGNYSDFICSWDYSNMYYGNNGSLACLADPTTDIAVLNIRNISTYLSSLGLQANQFRALCRNNSLALTPGVTVDDNCLLAYVVDAEVLSRRNDPLYNALNTFFDHLEQYFGYNSPVATQLINFELFSPFDGIRDLLFRVSTIGLTEPTIASSHEPARNYMELFAHLDACSAATPIVPGSAARNALSVFTFLVMFLMAKFVVY